MSIDALIDAWQAAWSGREPTAFQAVCAQDVHYEDPLCKPPAQGPDELAAYAERLWSAFPDARLERTGPRLNDGHFVLAPCKLTGTHEHDLDGIPATQRPVLVHILFYCELDTARRRLWRVRGFFDAYDAAVQIGVLPRRGTLGERALMVMRGYGLLPRRRR